MDYETILLEAQDAMDAAVKHATHEFSTLHTGKAAPSMIENVSVDVEAYGTSMPLRELGAITVPDNRTLQVQPWDKNTVKAVEKAIRNAGLGLNPVSRGGGTIIVPVPELSGDRRKELVKMASSHAEDSRVSVRQARHHAMEELKKLKNEGHVSEDDIKRHEKEIQEETDKHVALINEALAAKEDELMTV
ncbi:MAG: ribosome recycling factor [Verrucomicrobia bacterium]|jgi:ribosome recycling factor|nr:ribosome recycling factor [Verrucomicrobiota bacterium]